MDETPTNHPGVPTETYHTLGKKTLAIFTLQRVQGSFVLLVISFALFVIQDQSFLTSTPLTDLPRYVALATWIIFGLFIIIFLIGFFISWFIYINYKFFLGENSLKIKRGILTKEEIAIPYRQIQDVDIERDISFQVLGLSRIVILTAGEIEEKSKDKADQSEGVLPALDKDLAEWLQGELLRRANVQKVTEVAG